MKIIGIQCRGYIIISGEIMKKTAWCRYIILITCIAIYALSPGARAEEKILSIDTDASCITDKCHDTMGKKRFIHKAGIDPLQCKRCHEIERQGEHTFKQLPTDTRTLCAPCHERGAVPPPDIKESPPRVIFEDESTRFHEPFAEGKCTACHDAHENDYMKHLKAEYPADTYTEYSDNKYSLCYSAECHKGLESVFIEPRTLTLTKFRNGNLNLHFRHVNKKKGRICKVCHHHHGSRNPALIRETLPFGNRQLAMTYEKTDSGGNCTTPCHRIAQYDRYKPALNLIRTSPRPGADATEQELEQSRERDLQEEQELTPDDNTKSTTDKSQEEQELTPDDNTKSTTDKPQEEQELTPNDNTKSTTDKSQEE
jgi:predicted CXXCH cytochrome family protein